MDKEENKKEEVVKKEVNNENKEPTIKIKIGTVGNFMLAFFVVLIIGTGSLTYYLIHNAKNDYDRQYNEILSNITQTQQVEENTTEENVSSIGDLIDSALSNVVADTSTNTTNTNTLIDSTDTRKTANQELVVLYKGLILDNTNFDENTLKYIDSTKADADKYVITYYSYENYSFKEAKLGVLSQKVYDNSVKIDNVGKVAISEEYEAVPRQIKVVNTVPSIISDNNPLVKDYDTVKTISTDFDGNGTEEYILILKNTKTGFSKITFIDSKGEKVADLASIEKSKWKQDANNEYYLGIDNVEILDINNDGVMEILVEIPHSTGDPTVSLLKYNNGELQGKTNIECSLLSE